MLFIPVLDSHNHTHVHLKNEAQQVSDNKQNCSSPSVPLPYSWTPCLSTAEHRDSHFSVAVGGRAVQMESKDKGYYSKVFPIPKRDGDLGPTLGLSAVTAHL